MKEEFTQQSGCDYRYKNTGEIEGAEYGRGMRGEESAGEEHVYRQSGRT